MPMIQHTSILEAEADRAWAVIQRFGDIADWHPAIHESLIEDGLSDRMVGCIRRLTLADGGLLRERLLAVDEPGRTLTYRFEESPLPVDDYVLTVEVLPVTNQPRALLRWTARFDVRSATDHAAVIEIITGLIAGGDASLHAFLEAGRDRRAPLHPLRKPKP